MKILFQFALTLLAGCGALYAGVVNFYSPADVLATYYTVDISMLDSGSRLAIESQVRLLAGMWIGAAIAIFISVTQFEKHGNAIRWVLFGMAIGSLGEAFTALALQGDRAAALLKAAIQIGLYIGLDCWRVYLVGKKTAQNA